MHATVNGARLYYECDGAGNPPLVFVHGYACAHDDWVRQVDAFRPQYTVVACDLRGHGTSPGEPSSCDIETFGADIAGLLPALGLESALLVGHSMGCRIVLQAYRAASERIMERAMRMPEAIGASLFPKMVAWDAKHMSAALAHVKIPLLVIQSTYLNNEHKRVPLKPGQSTPWLDLVRQLAPHAQIKIITGSGHFPMLDNPAAVNSAIAAFVDKVTQ